MRASTATLPLIAFVLLTLVVRRGVDGWRVAVLTAAVLWGVLTVAFTEALSRPHAFTFLGVLAFWSVSVALLGWAVWRGPGVTPLRSIARGWSSLGWDLRAGLIALAILVASVGVVALVAPPNTHDSMVYHMGRVVHWIQNRSVAPYRTFIERQIQLGPGAEFVVAHLQLLAGGDRFANLVQWSAMLGSLVGVSLTARLLEGGPRAQCLSALVAATIPMGVLQASSTKNDYVVAFWLVCLAVFVLRGSHPALVGAALGLATLTKATGVLFALPLLVWFASARILRDRRAAWRALALVFVVALALNGSHLLRNMRTYGKPLGAMSEGPQYRYVNLSIGLRPMLSVALRNLGVHLATPWPDLNAATERAVADVHGWLGLDVDAPGTTWGDTSFQVLPPSPDETTAPNGLHLLLFVAAGVVVLLGRRWKLAGYALVVVVGFLIFSLTLRWQPWHSRLELPLFVLAAPLIGAVLGPRRLVGPLVAAVLLVLAFGSVLWNTSRPVVGPASVFRVDREEQYFVTNPDQRAGYRAGLMRVRDAGCRHIGLVMGGNDMEYPLWVIARRLFGDRVRFDHLNLNPVVPCAVLVTDPGVPLPAEHPVSGGTYRRELTVPPVTVYIHYPR